MRTIERIRQDIARRQNELHTTSVALDSARVSKDRKGITKHSCQLGFIQRALRCLAAEAERAVENQI